MARADLIVVGGGTSGCLLAHELVTKYGLRVTLIEPQADAANAIDRVRPARWLNLIGSAEDYGLTTEPAAGLSGRSLQWPRGRGLGGSSRINAMIWAQPTERDRRILADAAAPHWGIEELRDAERRVESLVRPEKPRWLSEPSTRFLKAAECIDGAVAYAYLRFNRSGRRWTAEQLLRGLDGSGLQVVRGRVEGLVWRRDAAVGVSVWCGGVRETLRADRGVVLSAGAIGSPAILMQSGVGPVEALRSVGIDARTAAEGVGANLQDHLIFPVVFEVPNASRFPGHLSSARSLARWQALGTGPLASNIAECGGLFDGGRIQMHVTPTHYLRFPATDSPAAMTIGVNVTQPASRGRLSVRGSYGSSPPEIEANYLAQASDLAELVRAVELARRIASAVPLRGWVSGEIVPGPRRSDRRSLEKAIRRYSQSLYHPVGTCAMGPASDASQAGGVPETAIDPVVDGTFAVNGVDRLWVVDASILPSVTVTNPSVTILALAAIAAERIAGSGVA